MFVASSQFVELIDQVFMRLGSDAVRATTGTSDPVEAMGKLREMKVRA